MFSLIFLYHIFRLCNSGYNVAVISKDWDKNAVVFKILKFYLWHRRYYMHLKRNICQLFNLSANSSFWLVNGTKHVNKKAECVFST